MHSIVDLRNCSNISVTVNGTSREFAKKEQGKEYKLKPLKTHDTASPATVTEDVVYSTFSHNCHQNEDEMKCKALTT